MERKRIKVIISGGGTGGHIFPAVSIANALRELMPSIEILFVGALGKMEMEKVPASGYKIVGLPVVGLQRKFTFKNLAFPFKLWKSLRLAKDIIADFNPNVVVGVGGYASGPVLKVAQRMGIPTLIQEQNSYAGVTNKLLARKAKAICVAYQGMEAYFPADKITLTGNPVRQGLNSISPKSDEAYSYFNIAKGTKVILVIGGSLGAKSINQSILGNIHKVASNKSITLIWQTGNIYIDDIKEHLRGMELNNVWVADFINRMDLAYSIADIVVSRAGACTISELCLVGKPAILVPSPNVAEDHQTKNAKALSSRSAAILIKDADAYEQLVDKTIATINNEKLMNELALNIHSMALPNAAADIASRVLQLSK